MKTVEGGCCPPVRAQGANGWSGGVDGRSEVGGEDLTDRRGDN